LPYPSIVIGKSIRRIKNQVKKEKKEKKNRYKESSFIQQKSSEITNMKKKKIKLKFLF